MTAATMFMDVTTNFADSGGYTPKDYDLLERGPLRMRSALQWSLNIPAVKALAINGVDRVFQMAQSFGMTFQNDTPSAGLSLTLGTEVTHPRDVAEAYGTLANEGNHIGYTHILRITDGSGNGPGRPVRAAGRRRGRQPAGGLRHDRHPRLEHRSQAEPHLGRLRASARPTARAGRRRSRPAPTTTPMTSSPSATCRRPMTPGAPPASTRWSSAPGTATRTATRC